MTGRTPPVALVLNGVRFSSNPSKNLLVEPVIVAQVLKTPAIEDNEDFLYQSASNELRINGTGFMGAKKVDLYFQPPLVKAVAYEDVTRYPLVKDQVVLRLRHEFHISGTGFPELETGYKPKLRFSPELTEGVDYTLRVVDRTDMLYNTSTVQLLELFNQNSAV